MFTVAECEKYLQRIDYQGGLTPSIANLKGLMMAHLTHVPFETVSMRERGAVPDLSMEALYEKIVENRRGGYCFELNKLFQELLISLGYSAKPGIARSTDTPGQIDPLNHRGLIVAFDDRCYCADVGYGGPMPAGPLPLSPGSYVIEDATFIVEKSDDGWWIIDRIDSKGKRRGLMELSDFRVNEEDFDPLNMFCGSPGSIYRDSVITNIRTRDGSASIENGELTVRSRGEKQVRKLEPHEMSAVLKKYFGLQMQ